MKSIKRWLKPYTFNILILIAISIIKTYFQLMLPTSLGELVNAIIEGNVDLASKGVYMLIVTLVVVLTTIAITAISADVSSKIAVDFRREVYGHIMKFSKKEIDSVGISSLITRSTGDITNIQNVLMGIFRTVLTAPIMFVGGSILAFRADRKVSIILFASVPLLLAIKAMVSKKTVPMHRSIQRKIDGLNKVVREQLRGIRDIRAFNKQEFEKERFNSYNEAFKKERIRVDRITGIISPITTLLMNLFTLVIVWFGAKSVLGGTSTVGNYVALSQYTAEVYKSITLFAMLFSMYPRAYASYKRISEVLSVQPSIQDGTVELNTSVDSIEFDNVSFKYDGSHNDCVKELSFVANKGEITAVVGSTGSGKTTICNLISRDYDTQSGNILINGIDIKDYTVDSLNKRIVCVPQKASLFEASIKENITMTDEVVPEAEIEQVINMALCNRIIENIDGGLEYIVSQAGSNLSGGQKQRLSIARALLKNADAYIFDDCFSALDYKTDKMIRNNLSTFIKDKVVIIISQRIRTIMNADKIIVIDKGKVVGMGKHEELIETCKEYGELVLSQKEGL